MKRKSKCYATPKWAKFCDGCRTNSTKCPYREKTRDGRHRQKAEAQKEIQNGIEKYNDI